MTRNPGKLTVGRVVWRGSGVLAIVLISLILGTLPLAAQDGTCLDDVTGQINICTANDVRLGTFYNATTGSCPAGALVTLNLRADLLAGANERYDVGLFIALDGGDARTGTCYRDYLPPPLAGPGEYIPGSPLPGPDGGPFLNAEMKDDPQDLCGDLEQGVNTYYDLAPDAGGITVPCTDVDGDGYLDVAACVSWDNQRTNTCLDVNGAVPNTKSKCRCEMLTIGNVLVEPGALEVLKEASPDSVTEPGGNVTFTFTAQNLSSDSLTLDSLVDTVFGDLNGYAGGTCTLPQTLAAAGQPGDSYECAITVFIGGPIGIHTDLVVAIAHDAAGAQFSDTAAAEVTVLDLPPNIQVVKAANPETVPEPGGQITYAVDVTNNSGAHDPVTLTVLEDDHYGDLTDDGNSLISDSTCELVTIPPGTTYSCSFKAEVTGSAGGSLTDTVTALVVDDDGSESKGEDSAVVTIVSGPPDTGVTLPVPLLAGGFALLGTLLLGVGLWARRGGR